MPAFAAILLAASLLPPAPPQVTVSDFESGLGGWRTNDAAYTERRAPQPTLVSIAAVGRAHSGSRCLEVQFHPGSGWANAYLDADSHAERWAEIRAD